MDTEIGDREIDTIDKCFITAERGKIYEAVIGRMEKMVIEKALKYSYGNQVKAAKMLGINRNTMHAKIKKLNIDIRQFKS